MPYVARTGLLDMWRSAGGFPYFRPLGGTVWRLLFELNEGHDPLALHLLNILVHAFNGFLTGLLAYRLTRHSWQVFTRQQKLPVAGWITAVVSATLFLLYPFSYQAVPWIGALYHLLATSLILITLIAFDRWRASGRRLAFFVSLAAAFLAPFAHENGVVALALVFLYEWIVVWPVIAENSATIGRRLRSTVTVTIWWVIPLIGWLIVWLAAPKRGGAGGFWPNNLETLWQNSVYMMQGIAYPLTWVGGFLRENRGWNDLQAIVGLAIVGLVIIGLVWWFTQARVDNPAAVWIYPLSFAGLTALPAVLFLDFAYLLSSPRLLMLPSVGIAILWGNTLAAAVTSTPAEDPFIRQISRVSLIILIILTIVHSVNFIGYHMRQHAMLGRVWQEAVIHTLDSQAHGRSSILINFPGGLTGHQTTYALGHEGTVFMVDYIPKERIVEVNGGRTATFDFKRYDDIRPEMPYIYGVAGSGQSWAELLAESSEVDVFNTNYEPRDISLALVGGRQPAVRESVESTPLASFRDQGVFLQSGSFSTSTEDEVQVDLVWQIDEAPSFELTTFVHVLDSQGALIAQRDGHAWANTFPMGEWEPGSTIRDLRHIKLPAGTNVQEIQVRIGLYNWVTAERILADVDGFDQPADGVTLER